MNTKTFKLPKLADIKTADEARQLAIDYQNYIGEVSMSYGNLAMYSGSFIAIADKFDLTEEFKENGII